MLTKRNGLLLQIVPKKRYRPTWLGCSGQSAIQCNKGLTFNGNFESLRNNEKR